MTFAHKLEYAGSKPYQPERDRVDAGDMTYYEFEMLSQDEVYQRLAEVRWLASELERDVAGDTDIHEDTRASLFRAVAATDAPLAAAVDYYVAQWLAEFREGWGAPEGPSDDGSDAAKEDA